MPQTLHYKLSIIGALVSSIAFTALAVFAIAPGETLDPVFTHNLDCPNGPTDPGCIISSTWQLDLVNGYVFNDTDLVGIGTSTPSVALDVVGDILQTTTLPSGGLQITKIGDTSAYGDDEGFISLAVDSLTPTALVQISGDLRTNQPVLRLSAQDAVYDLDIILDTATGDIDINADGGGDLNLNTTGVGGDISLSSEGTTTIRTLGDLSITSESAWYGGVNDGTTNAGIYRSEFSQTPFDPVPAIILELKNNQNHAMGFAALDEGLGGKQYANIYYGKLNPGNVITDITRIEASQNGVNAIFIHDIANNHTNTIDIRSNIVLQTQGVGGGGEMRIENNGNFTMNRGLDGTVLTLSDNDNSCAIDPDTGFSCSSDRTLKTNINEITSGLDLIMRLNPVTYHWLANPDQQINYGFIAQEVQDVIPEFVSIGNNGKLLLNQTNMISPIVSAIQEMNEKIDFLEQQTVSQGGFSLSSLRNIVKNFLSDIGNGIQDIFAERVTTKELCVGNRCINEEQFNQMIDLIEAQESVINVEIIEVPEQVEAEEIVDDEIIIDDTVSPEELIIE